MEIRHFRPRAGSGRRGAAALAAVVAAGLVVAASTRASTAAAGAPAAGEAAAAEPFLSLSERPSHHGAFRAAVVETEGEWTPDAAQAWVLRVTGGDGAPVRGAALRAGVWSPDSGERPAAQPAAAVELGGGLYRVDGLRFPGPGWWSVDVRIAAAGRTDSLAFNLVLPAAARRPGGRGGRR